MRTDHHAAALPLTVDQHFFVSCWHNLIHQYSLDSHRVRTMNPGNVLQELLRNLEAPHANETDRTLIREETASILHADPVLRTPLFTETTNTLVSLLKACKAKKQGEAKPPNIHLIPYIARELYEEINRSYVSAILSLLHNILLADPPIRSAEECQNQIATVTGGLLGTLIDRGASLESLFQLYRQVLVPARLRKKYIFERKFGLLCALINQSPRTYRLLFAIDNLSNSHEFPREMGGIQFAKAADSWNSPYAQPRGERLFAEVTVESKDPRAAGTDAYTRISNVLDLARFEYERERVHLAEEFLIKKTDAPEKIQRFPIPKLVPNPFAKIATLELTIFVASVNDLLSAGKFSTEDRDRVLSAFRLYRNGADTNSFEGKLVSWWTATEYLVRGAKASKPIGASVEEGITPIICLTYAEKLLLDIKHTLLNCGHGLTDPASGTAIALNRLNLVDTYQVLTRADIHPVIQDALAADPYVQQRTCAILNMLADAKKFDAALGQHEQRIRWQLQRLWRARCDILHSARLMASGVLLCANLEFYLKITLMNLLSELRRIKTLGSPEEFFERGQFQYSQLRDSLSKNSTTMLIRLLSNAAA